MVVVVSHCEGLSLDSQCGILLCVTVSLRLPCRIIFLVEGHSALKLSYVKLNLVGVRQSLSGKTDSSTLSGTFLFFVVLGLISTIYQKLDKHCATYYIHYISIFSWKLYEVGITPTSSKNAKISERISCWATITPQGKSQTVI